MDLTCTTWYVIIADWNQPAFVQTLYPGRASSLQRTRWSWNTQYFVCLELYENYVYTFSHCEIRVCAADLLRKVDFVSTFYFFQFQRRKSLPRIRLIRGFYFSLVYNSHSPTNEQHTIQIHGPFPCWLPINLRHFVFLHQPNEKMSRDHQLTHFRCLGMYELLEIIMYPGRQVRRREFMRTTDSDSTCRWIPKIVIAASKPTWFYLPAQIDMHTQEDMYAEIWDFFLWIIFV